MPKWDREPVDQNWKKNPRFEPRNLDEALGLLVEECGEVLKPLGKALRFDLEAVNPLLPPEQQETCRHELLRELNDLEHAIHFTRAKLTEGRRKAFIHQFNKQFQKTDLDIASTEPNTPARWPSADHPLNPGIVLLQNKEGGPGGTENAGFATFHDGLSIGSGGGGSGNGDTFIPIDGLPKSSSGAHSHERVPFEGKETPKKDESWTGGGHKLKTE